MTPERAVQLASTHSLAILFLAWLLLGIITGLILMRFTVTRFRIIWSILTTTVGGLLGGVFFFFWFRPGDFLGSVVAAITFATVALYFHQLVEAAIPASRSESPGPQSHMHPGVDGVPFAGGSSYPHSSVSSSHPCSSVESSQSSDSSYSLATRVDEAITYDDDLFGSGINSLGGYSLLEPADDIPNIPDETSASDRAIDLDEHAVEEEEINSLLDLRDDLSHHAIGLSEPDSTLRAGSDPDQPSSTEAKKTTTDNGNVPSLAEASMNPPSVQYPDDLTMIKGIGAIYAQRLYDMGIFTWIDVARTEPPLLKDWVAAKASANVTEWPNLAYELAAVHDRLEAQYGGPAPQRLTRIKGISQRRERLLYQNGYVTYSKLAHAEPEHLVSILALEGASTEQAGLWIHEAGRLVSAPIDDHSE